MKTRDKIITTSTVIAMTAATILPFGGNVFAATTPTWTDGSSVTIKRIIGDAYSLTNNDFTYTITPSTSNPTGATGAPTTKTLEFSNSDSLVLGDKANTVDLSFNGMQFDRVGD